MLILHGSKLQLCADFEEFVRLQNFFIGYFACLKIFFSFSPSTNKMIYDILGRILRIQSQTTFESSIRIMNWTFDFYWMKISNYALQDCWAISQHHFQKSVEVTNFGNKLSNFNSTACFSKYFNKWQKDLDI